MFAYILNLRQGTATTLTSQTKADLILTTMICLLGVVGVFAAYGFGLLSGLLIGLHLAVCYYRLKSIFLRPEFAAA